MLLNNVDILKMADVGFEHKCLLGTGAAALCQNYKFRSFPLLHKNITTLKQDVFNIKVSKVFKY